MIAVFRCLAILPALLAAVPSAVAQTPSAPIGLELNSFSATGEACQATMVVTNGLQTPLDSLKLDLVFFDGAGIVARRLAAELGPLTAGKTAVKMFPVAGMACGGISRVLINDVLACAGPTGPVEACVEKIRPTSRAASPLDK